MIYILITVISLLMIIIYLCNENRKLNKENDIKGFIKFIEGFESGKPKRK